MYMEKIDRMVLRPETFDHYFSDIVAIKLTGYNYGIDHGKTKISEN